MRPVRLVPVPPCTHPTVKIVTGDWVDGGIDKQTGKKWRYRFIYTVCQDCNEQLGPAEYEEEKD